MTFLTETIKAEMYARGITQSELSEAIGIDKATVNKKLNGRSNLTIPEVLCIAAALDMTVYKLMELTERREQLYAEKE